MTDNVLYHDRQRGVKVTLDIDPETGNQIFKQYDDIDDALAYNDVLRSIEQAPLAGNTQRHVQHVASIPLPIYYLWKDILGDPAVDPFAEKRWRERLNSSEYQKFRVGGGRL